MARGSDPTGPDMPHLTLEYSKNLDTFSASAALLDINRALLASGQFEEADIKSRAIALDCCQIGVQDLPRAFIHAKLAILSGRSGGKTALVRTEPASAGRQRRAAAGRGSAAVRGNPGNRPRQLRQTLYRPLTEGHTMTALKLASRGLLAAALITGLSGVARADDDIDRVSLEGTLGQERIGMTLLIKNGKTLSGHYFMAATKDIPLRGKLQGETLRLSETGGGEFQLRFKNNGGGDGQPLGFDKAWAWMAVGR